MMSECRELSRGVGRPSAVYVSFSVGAVTVTLLSVIVSHMSTAAPTYLHTETSGPALRHRRALIGTVGTNDTVLDASVGNGTVLSGLVDSPMLSRVSDNLTTSSHITASSSSSPVISVSSTQRPAKPAFVDASKLRQDSAVADGSKYRHVIRQNLGRVPVEPHLTSSSSSSAVNRSTSPTVRLLQNTLRTNRTASGNTTQSASRSSSSSSSTLMTSDVLTSSSSMTLKDIMRQLESLATSRRRLSNDASKYRYLTTTTITTTATTIAAAAAAAAAVSNTASVVSVVSPTLTSSHSTRPASHADSSLSHAVSSLSLPVTRTDTWNSLSAGQSSSPVSTTTTRGSAYTVKTSPTRPPTAQHSTSSRSSNTTVSSSLSQHRADTLSTTGRLVLSAAVSAITSTPSSSSSSVGLAVQWSYQLLPLSVAAAALFVSVLSAYVSLSSSAALTASTSSYKAQSSTHIAVLTGCTLLYSCHSAVLWTYTGLLVQYADSVLHYDRSQCLSVLMLFWLGSALGRLLCCLLITRLRPWTLLFSTLLLSCLSALVMLLTSLQYSSSAEVEARNVLMWISSAVLGLSTSLVRPAADKYIPASTASLSLAVSVGLSLGQATVPSISAVMSEHYSSRCIIDAVLIGSLSAGAVSVVMKYITTRYVTSTTATSTALSSSHFHLLEDSSTMEDIDNVMDEEAELLSQAGAVDMETSLITNTNIPSSAATATTESSLQSFIRNISRALKHD